MRKTFLNSPIIKTTLDSVEPSASHEERGENSTTSIVGLVDAEAIGAPLGVTGRTVLNWAESKKIPTALKLGRIIRFDPTEVAKALGIRVR